MPAHSDRRKEGTNLVNRLRRLVVVAVLVCAPIASGPIYDNCGAD